MGRRFEGVKILTRKVSGWMFFKGTFDQGYLYVLEPPHSVKIFETSEKGVITREETAKAGK